MGVPQELGRTNGEPLSPSEVRKRTRGIFSDYAQRANLILHPMVEKGEGKNVLGSVPGRPDDEQYQIDAMGEAILINFVRDATLPALVFGEHNIYDHSDGKPQVIFAIDSYDNSTEYSMGLDTPVYSVLGAYNPDGSPIGAVILDIRGQKAYVSIKKVNHIIDLSSIGRPPQEIEPLPMINSIQDDRLTIATYLGSNDYSLKFVDNFRDLVENMPKKSRIYPNGGSFIYAFLATGAVDSYIMFDEPNSEILPGLPIALAAGCVASSVDLVSGGVEEYKKFNTDFIKNPEGYTDGAVDLFIVARSLQLRDEIVEYYLKGRKD